MEWTFLASRRTSPVTVEMTGGSGEDGTTAFAESDIRTFLIADIRGYTRFTQEHGDEAGARLASAFAGAVRETVESHGGRLVELRGDEALVVFGSARQALRTATELQRRFAHLSTDDPSLPLRVGIGLDVGEAVAVGEGFRGGALNLAARLCSLAKPGEVLLTDGVAHLARKVEGIGYGDRGRISFKGIREPVHVMEARFELALPPDEQPLPWWRRSAFLVSAGALLCVVVAAVIVTTVIGFGSDATQERIGPNAVGEIDVDKAELIGEFPVGNGPSDIAVELDSLWVSNAFDGTVSRIDLRGDRPGTTIRVGGDPAGIAVGEDAVWVARESARSVVQINRESNTVVRTIAVGNGPAAIAVGAGSVWVANRIDGTVSRLDPRTGRQARVIPIGGQLGDLVVNGASVWVSRPDAGSVIRIDARTGQIVKVISVGNGALGLVASGEAIWVANSEDDTVSKIEPATNSVGATIGVGDDPTALAAAGNGIWVSNRIAGTVMRIDLEDGRVDETIEVGNSPNAIAAGGERIWATALVPLAVHQGGTLRVETNIPLCHCFDPAVLPDIDTWRLAIGVYDGLVGFRRVGGPRGSTLVADLATTLPTATDGGRTYRFELRRGIRFSTGRAVQAGDFRASMEEMLYVASATLPPFYSGIVGAAACASHPLKRCDLSKGIETNDASGTIVVRLTAPDPDFLYKLALPFASVVPSGSRRGERPVRGPKDLKYIGSRTLPGTGPYRVARFVPDRELRLVRNTNFREWSRDAQPDGYPDVMEVRYRGSEPGAPAAVAAVARGRSDWVTHLSPGDIRRYAVDQPAQLHLSAASGTDFMFLNTRVPPFSDLRVRQALNYAIDRKRIVELVGGSGAAEVTCQLFPPSFPGYSPYCPYTRRPGTDLWTAPDLARAHALVTASGTRGARIGILVGPPKGARLGPYFRALLRKLGYRAYLRPSEFVPAEAGDPRTRSQIGELGWVQDFSAPSNFYFPLFSCAAIDPTDNTNFTQSCDPALDRQAKRAASLQLTDPIAAGRAWAGVDRAVVDRALFVPLFTPRNADLVSRRVGNYQSSAQFGVLLHQLWVR